MQIEKEHKKSTLMTKKKQELADRIMWLEHNNNALQQTLDTQAKNFLKMTNWIHVSKQLPEDGTYLCTLEGKLRGLDKQFAEMCRIENGVWEEESVIAWMPLPEPYTSVN